MRNEERQAFFNSSFIIPRSSFQEGDFAVHDAREVFAVAHDPRDASAAAREFGPLACLLGVLFDEGRAFCKLDVAEAGAREASNAASAAEELLEGDEDYAGGGRVFARLGARVALVVGFAFVVSLAHGRSVCSCEFGS